MAIGRMLEELIESNNTKVADVSKSTGVKASTIYSIIDRDSKSANITDLYKLAHHLGVTLDYFYEGEKSSPVNDELDSKIIKLFASLTKSEKEYIIKSAEAIIDLRKKND